MPSKSIIIFYARNWVISLAGKLSLNEHYMELKTIEYLDYKTVY